MPKFERISVFGMTVPVPNWTVTLIGLVVVIGTATTVYKQVAPADLVTLRQANDTLAAEVREYGLHMSEEPEQTFFDSDGTMRVEIYRDHCVLIQRRGTASGVLTRLVTDIARGSEPPVRRSSSIIPVVEAAAMPGRCLNPHPGQFESWYGSKHGEWIEVWRRWADGCVHVQLMNVRSGAWETNQDGTPRVRWVECRH